MVTYGQTIPYTPLNLDTSCFWIQKYHDYHGSQPQINIQGEVLHYIDRDTIILGQTYHRVRGYATANMIGSTNSISAWNAYVHYNPTIHIREDTIAKKIYRRSNYAPYNEEVLLNFDLALGDSITYAPPDSPNIGNRTVDSISMITYFGVSRRTSFANFVSVPNINYARIEGVGATVNFPDVRTVEWGIPVYTLQAFVKRLFHGAQQT